jgi:hypothetical protein
VGLTVGTKRGMAVMFILEFVVKNDFVVPEMGGYAIRDKEIVDVSLPKKSTYVQKPTYASLANFSEGEFKSPRGRLSVTKST